MSDTHEEASLPDSTSATSASIVQDDMIIKQQEAIDKEISSNIALVGLKEEIQQLLGDYSLDPVYQSKVQEISKAYHFIRRTRPDGNCFFRAYCYSLLESLIKKPEIRPTIRQKLVEAKQLLTDAGFVQFTVEDFYDTFLDMVDQVIGGMAEEDLYNKFQDQGVADYLVVFLRILTSAELRKNAEFYSNFIEGEQSLEEFCQLEVEPMYKESDQIHIIALTAALGFGVRVVYMDRGMGATHDFGSNPTVNVLYRPGHYDIIYAE